MEQLSCLCDLEDYQSLLINYRKELDGLEKESMANKLGLGLKDLEEKVLLLKAEEVLIKSKMREAEKRLKDYNFEIEEVRKSLYQGNTTDIKQLEYLDLERVKLKEVINNAEIEVLEFMEEIEETEDKLTRLEKKAEKLRSENMEDIRKHKEKRSLLEEKIVLEEERVLDLEKVIDKGLLERYYRIRKSKGTAIALVKSNSCSGCNIFIPMILIDKLNKKDEIIYCENCGRILCKLK